MNLQKQELYGGAISILLPSGFIDVSQIREIPDNQEVYVNNNEGQGNESVIIELMESVEEKNNEAALLEHVKEIVEINYSNDPTAAALASSGVSNDLPFEIQNVETIAKNRLACIVKQKNVGKWSNNKEKIEELDLYLGLIRLEEFDTDVLITVNIPEKTTGQEQQYVELLKEIVTSFTLHDKSLFG